MDREVWQIREMQEIYKDSVNGLSKELRSRFHASRAKLRLGLGMAIATLVIDLTIIALKWTTLQQSPLSLSTMALTLIGAIALVIYVVYQFPRVRYRYEDAVKQLSREAALTFDQLDSPAPRNRPSS
ncbi:hypothetical protein MLGJGCBP_03387 [Rhodococcus sp. T7]|nr:hypothetical protein MLGJGCBP_09524 [Rhodococcus sp. T7]KAF0963487.1 hypothetical protein MLGJGCBP_03387 [Rhodococcus sp. T7]